LDVLESPPFGRVPLKGVGAPMVAYDILKAPSVDEGEIEIQMSAKSQGKSCLEKCCGGERRIYIPRSGLAVIQMHQIFSMLRAKQEHATRKVPSFG
jgi:hypothetical protein